MNNKKEYYREQIVEMVQKIENCDILIYIYKAVLGVVDEKKEKEQNMYERGKNNGVFKS